MIIKKVTPVRIVDRIEPCLPFWCEALGYEKRAEVPHDGRLGFVILGNAVGEVMLQTKESLAVDLPEVAARAPGTVFFVEVASLAEAQAKLGAVKSLIAPRTTPYGTREIVVEDPQGTLLILAEPSA